MAVLKEVEDILQAGKLEGLLGRAEDVFFEVKSQGYDLDSASDRYELAKDVSAFANAEGGHLLIGLKTRRLTEQNADVVDSLSLLAPEEFPANRYQGVLNSHVIPEIRGLSISFIPEAEGPQGLGVILVPPQDPDVGPFLICKVVEEGEYLKQIVAGFARRKGDSAEPLSAEELQKMLKEGSDLVAQRLSRIEDKLDSVLDRLAEPEEDAPIDRELRDKRIAEVLEAAG